MKLADLIDKLIELQQELPDDTEVWMDCEEKVIDEYEPLDDYLKTTMVMYDETYNVVILLGDWAIINK